MPNAHRPPNVVFIFADQMRAEAAGYAGNPDVATPHMDALAREGVAFRTAVANCPVCTPYRASLLTGRHALSTGLFVNDVRLGEDEVTIAEVLRDTGYDTGYIGKWHLDGPERSAFTPPGPRRQGFDYWAVGNCTHRYMRSLYYLGDDPTPRYWPGYDALAQADLAAEYIRTHGRERPYCLFLSWGPPHNPYRDVPPDYLAMYDPAALHLRPNVEEDARELRDSLAGYYAHITALDEGLGRILRALEEADQEEDTILVFTSDHGDMLGSQGKFRKQWPWDESVRVPFIVRYPRHQRTPCTVDAPVGAVDLMPTLLSLAGAPLPGTVEGHDLSHLVLGGEGTAPRSALIESIAPFAAAWPGPEWRGLRTARHTYVETLEGPWLLYDDAEDPCQTRNLVGEASSAGLQEELAAELRFWLECTGDDFQPGHVYMERWGYPSGPKGEVPYTS